MGIAWHIFDFILVALTVLGLVITDKIGNNYLNKSNHISFSYFEYGAIYIIGGLFSFICLCGACCITLDLICTYTNFLS